MGTAGANFGFQTTRLTRTIKKVGQGNQRRRGRRVHPPRAPHRPFPSRDRLRRTGPLRRHGAEIRGRRPRDPRAQGGNGRPIILNSAVGDRRKEAAKRALGARCNRIEKSAKWASAQNPHPDLLACFAPPRGYQLIFLGSRRPGGSRGVRGCNPGARDYLSRPWGKTLQNPPPGAESPAHLDAGPSERVS